MPHLPTLLIQIGVVLVVARLVGFLFRKIHQPQVMGEMVAGILLGPSLLGG
jgi:Kef-type K+ transport system membrane component KefB